MAGPGRHCLSGPALSVCAIGEVEADLGRGAAIAQSPLRQGQQSAGGPPASPVTAVEQRPCPKRLKNGEALEEC